MIDKKELCQKILDFLGFKDVSLREHTLTCERTLKFTSKSRKTVYPVFNYTASINKVWTAFILYQSIPFNYLCDAFLTDIVMFKYVDSYGRHEKNENNPFNGLSIEEALVFLDLNGSF